MACLLAVWNLQLPAGFPTDVGCWKLARSLQGSLCLMTDKSHLTKATRTAGIAIAEQQSNVTLCFMSALLINRNSGPNYHC